MDGNSCRCRRVQFGNVGYRHKWAVLQRTTRQSVFQDARWSQGSLQEYRNRHPCCTASDYYDASQGQGSYGQADLNLAVGLAALTGPIYAVSERAGWSVAAGKGAVIGGFVVSAEGQGLQIVPQNLYANSARDACLWIREYPANLVVEEPGKRFLIPRSMDFDKTRRLDIRRLPPPLGWCWEFEGRVYPIKDAAKAIMGGPAGSHRKRGRRRGRVGGMSRPGTCCSAEVETGRALGWRQRPRREHRTEPVALLASATKMRLLALADLDPSSLRGLEASSFGLSRRGRRPRRLEFSKPLGLDRMHLHFYASAKVAAYSGENIALTRGF